MQDAFVRYGCQVALPGFGQAGQQKLKAAKVLVVGMGGLGCPAAQYLAACGVGTLGIADFDTVSLSNLHRQVLYTPADAGQKKVVVAASHLSRQNPEIKVVAHDVKIAHANVMKIVHGYDIVVDCSDNFDARYLLNDACVLLSKPLVYGAIYQYEGQTAVWNVENSDGTRTPNYRDIFPEVDASQVPNCVEGGVIPTIAGIIGCMQANEAIKYITGTGQLLAGKMLLVDAVTLQTRIIKTGAVTKTNISGLGYEKEMAVIPPTELKAGLGTSFYTLVDVRGNEERAAFNIGGLHIPLEKMEEMLHGLDVGKPVVFYCASGRRSGEAAKKAEKMFPKGHFLSLEGGLRAWMELG